MRTNSSTAAATQWGTTHAGGQAGRQTASMELERAVATCLLFENTFYEKGSDQATRIEHLCEAVSMEEIAALAVKARNDYKLRHVPLFLCRQLVRKRTHLDGSTYMHRHRSLIADCITSVVQRPDEMAELIALYWKDNLGKKSLPNQMKKGLAQAFLKFDAYQLGKWNRDAKVKLRDVLFLCHAKPDTEERRALWKQLIDGTIPVPDTWEVALSAGADKRETWTRLLETKKLGYMALLQNLRNMQAAGVDAALVTQKILSGARYSKALPFRFLSAAKHAPGYASVLSDAMVAATSDMGALPPGETVILVDVSGSMDDTISAKSELMRWEAAAALAALIREVSGQVVGVYTFSNALAEIPAYRGLAMVDGIGRSQPHGSTFLAQSLDWLKQAHPRAHRVIVITDEQSHDGTRPAWAPRSYLLNVAGYKPGLTIDGGWCRINGWSERAVDWMRIHETMEHAGS